MLPRLRDGLVVQVVVAVVGFIDLEMIQRLDGGLLLKEDVPLDPPGDDLEDLVFHEDADRDGEDVVQLLEGSLLGFCILEY